MSTQFPPSNVPANMQPFARALENSVAITENAQTNTSNIIRGMRQGIASNYGLGATLTDGAGSLTSKVYTDLQNLQSTPLSGTFQRSWTNFGTALTITSAAFESNVALAISGATHLNILGGDPGGTYQYWRRINVTGAVTGTKMIPVVDYGQALLYWNAVPASTVITLQMQVWGFIKNPNGTFDTGSMNGVVRLSASLRSIALV